MSQAGEIDVIGTHPEIPVEFIANVGTAVPIANQLELLGEVIASSGIPFQSVASGNTVTYQLQQTATAAAQNITLNGVAHFNSAHFTVSNGFVSLMGGGVAIDSLTTDVSGPVVPDGSGTVAFTGATNVFSDGSVANTMRLNLQGTNHALFVGRGTNTASASLTLGTNNTALLGVTGGDPTWGQVPNATLQNSTITLNNGNNITVTGSPISLGGAASIAVSGTTNHAVQVGNASGSLTSLAVGTNGQVIVGATGADPAFATLTSSDGSVTFTTGANTLSLQVSGGTTVGKTITGNSGGALSPTAGNWNILGSSAAAGTSPVTTSGAGSTLTVNVQTSQALSAADATKIGLSNFSSTDFAVAATGFVTLSTTGAGKTITGDTGGALSPTGNNWNILGSGSITTSGSGSTLTTQLTGLTNHAILVGAGTTTITKVGPTATAGQVLQSAGSSADPVFSTATYPSTATGTGTILRADGTNWVATTATYQNTTTQGDIIYASANNVYSNLAKNTSATRYLANTGTSNAPAWDQVSLLTGVSDYTVGTWTPTITGSGSNPTPTYTSQVGTYIKVGRLVYINCFITVSALTGGTGNMNISGLPFTSENTTNLQAFFTGLFVTANIFRLISALQPNQTVVQFLYPADGSAQGLPATTTTQISFSGCYRTAS